MICFNGEFTSRIFSAYEQKIAKDISSLSAEKMDKTDRNAWVDYFVSEYEIDLIEIHPETMEIDLLEKDVQVYSQWDLLSGRKLGHIAQPGIQATCTVEYTGDSDLFQLSPSTFSISTTYDVDKIEPAKSDAVGRLHFSYEMTHDGADANAIQLHFERKIKDFMQGASRVNDDAAKFNAGLRSLVEREVDKRVCQLDKLATLRQSLNLPLNRVNGAPMSKPLVLPKRRLSFSEPVPTRCKEQPYSISDTDYEHITQIIDNCCAMMEAAPKSYIGFEEEQLRDHMLSVLNTHYVNASGETFRNNGKTDIYIPCSGDHAAYIAECKCWHGAKAFLRAIEQLFSYTTWRDTKVSIIVFNKTTKNYEHVLNSIDESLESRSVLKMRPKHAQWNCKIQNEEDERLMHVTVQAFNLHSS